MADATTEKGAFFKTLTGFTPELNWRPTEFTSAVQRIRCCALCTVVPSEAHVLRCSHVFCKDCYKRIAESDFVCPLDNKYSTEDQANRIEFSQQQLLAREVRCWNRRNGCNFVGRLAEALDHFHNVCDFHLVTCSKCNNPVVQRDVVGHCRSGCAGEAPRGAGAQRQNHEPRHPMVSSTPTTANSTVNDILEATKKIEAMINQLADNQASIQDSLNNFTATAREGMLEITAAVANQTCDIADVREKQNEFNRTSAMALRNMEVSLTGLPGMLHHQNRLKNVAPQTFHLSNDKVCWPVEGIMGHIANDNLTKIIGEPFMIGGYRARLTLKFDRSEADMEICAYFSLRPGPNDDDLDWPFIIPLKMVLVHPQDSRKEKRRMIDPVGSRYPEIFVRPSEEVDHGEGGCIVKRSEVDEYVSEGALLLCAELVRDRENYNTQLMEAVLETVGVRLADLLGAS